MKIAILVYRLNIKGGTQRQALLLANELIKLGHEVKLYTGNYSKRDCYEDLLEGIDVIALSDKFPNWENKAKKILGLFVRPNYLFKYLNKIDAFKKMAELIDDDIDVLNPHGNHVYHVPYYYFRLRKRVPAVWMLNAIPQHLINFKSIMQVDKSDKIKLLKKFFYRIVRLNELRFINSNDKIVVVAKREKEMVKTFFHRDSNIIRCGMDLDKFRFIQRHPINDTRSQRILAAAIMLPYRRFEDIISAIAILREQSYKLTLSIIGDTNADRAYFKKLTKMTNDLNLNDVVSFLGRVSDEVLLHNYRTCDIFVFSSEMQSWGLAPFEAMSSGMPAVVSRGSGAHEVLTDGENALLVNARAPQEIAAAIKKLIDDNSLYIRLSKNGRGFLEKNISWAKYTKEMLEEFKDAQNKVSQAL